MAAETLRMKLKHQDRIIVALKKEVAELRAKLEQAKSGHKLPRMTQMRVVPELKQLELPLAV